MPRNSLFAAALLLLQPMCLAAWSAEPDVDERHAEKMKAGLELFKASVGATLRDHCLRCHNAGSRKADFDLSSRAALFESGHVGASAADSHLMQVVRHAVEPYMPLEADKLSEVEIEALARWIDLGAPYDQPLGAAASGADGEVVTDEDRAFWSFAPLKQVDRPVVVDNAWCRTDIDYFILARLEEAGIQPNRAAERRVLIRRVYYDLIGLPPHPAEVQRFLADEDPQAYERLIDRLLASRHYGERWARHWLDVARFAESAGFEHDDDRPHAYHYRDFVIKAFNNDLPFNDFIRWQLAGDELAPENPLALAATGFLGAGTFPTQLTEAEFESARYDEIDDMVANTGLAFLGLSIGCARCHDHKYDPISARDYYAVAATFAKTVRSEIELVLEPAASPAKLQVTADGFPPMKNHADGRGYPYFYDQVYLLNRGDVDQKQEVAEPGFVRVLVRSDTGSDHWPAVPPDGWDRSDFYRSSLAAWIVDPQHGAGHLAARVIVNRLWQHHVGRGLVATPNDFGVRGDRPTHPRLLDWLAGELIAHGWSLKHIHRLIMTSSVYMQDDTPDPQRRQVDPENQLVWRQTPRRLEAEAIRDAMLAVSQLLDRTMFGPGTLDETTRRRSVYFTIKRSKLIPTMMLFDWPEHLVSIGQRPVTTTAPQALLFMNNDQTRAIAEGFAKQIASHVTGDAKESPRTYDAAIGQAYQIAYGRLPSEQENELAKAFLTQQLALYNGQDGAQHSALTDFAHMILSSNEFVFVR